MKVGRKTKYHTEEEKREQVRMRSRRYYEKNREVVKRRNLKRYHEQMDKKVLE